MTGSDHALDKIAKEPPLKRPSPWECGTWEHSLLWQWLKVAMLRCSVDADAMNVLQCCVMFMDGCAAGKVWISVVVTVKDMLRKTDCAINKQEFQGWKDRMSRRNERFHFNVRLASWRRMVRNITMLTRYRPDWKDHEQMYSEGRSGTRMAIWKRTGTHTRTGVHGRSGWWCTRVMKTKPFRCT